jgi:hypothetical protein
MCIQPFTGPFSITGQPDVPLYLGTANNLLRRSFSYLVAQILNAHPSPGLYGGGGMGPTKCT